MRNDVKEDWGWADLHLPTAFNVLRQNASHLVDFEIAPQKIDLEDVGDIVLSSNMGHIAFRVRRGNVAFRDLTLRSKRASGAITEIDKIRQGKGRWYLYAWSDGQRGFKDWILVDLDQFRESGLAFMDKPNIPNRDNGQTWFHAYSIDELNHANCLVAMHNGRLLQEKTTEPQPKHEQSCLFDDDMHQEAALHALHHQYYNES